MKRPPSWHWFHHELVRRDGPLLGVFAVAVYCTLVSFANEKQECWPAIPTIAKCLQISVNTVKRALDTLRLAGWIAMQQRFTEAGDPDTLLYVLLEKPEAPGGGSPHDPGSVTTEPRVGHQGATKNVPLKNITGRRRIPPWQKEKPQARHNGGSGGHEVRGTQEVRGMQRLVAHPTGITYAYRPDILEKRRKEKFDPLAGVEGDASSD